MQISYSRRRGAIIVFVLMAVIAVLALAVVFFSRAGRDDQHVQEAVTSESSPATTATAEESATDEPRTVIDAAGEQPEDVVPVPEPVIPPPAATPIPTMDKGTLPPEG